MNEWDDELTRAFERYCAGQRDAWRDEGADIDEVRNDLAAQVERWRSEAKGRFGKEELLERLGAGPDCPEPHPAGEAGGAPASSAHRENGFVAFLKGVGRGLFGSRTTPFWGVFLPAGVFLLECLAHWCGAVFFDPFPSAWHGLLVVVALAGSFLVWRAARAGVVAKPAARFVAGAAVVIGTYYSLLVAPVLLMAWGFWIASMFESLGISITAIPLVIAGSTITAAPLGLLMGLCRWRRFWWAPGNVGWAGLLAGLMALTAVEGPRLVARACLGGDQVKLARAAASRDALLLACYEGGGGTRAATDTSGWLWSWVTNPERFRSFAGVGSLDTDDARLFYYRVTGEAYNAVPQPRLHGFGATRQPGRQEIDWDPDVGGDAVASRLSGIHLASSRLDGHFEKASGLGYWEWTVVFRNSAPVEREARMQVLLPPGGVVSRLTLWVDGEPEEAAFGSSEATAAAYRSVAVVQRRDPVLVRWVGPDRNLVQCFPVPRNGGEMKIRLGIIAQVPQGGAWELPRIIERNFRIDGDAENTVWVQGDAVFAMDALDRESRSGPWQSRKGTLPAALLAHDAGAVTVDLGAGERRPPVIWCRDPFAGGEQPFLISEPGPGSAGPGPVKKIVAVIDGSAGMAPWRDDLVEALGKLAEGRPVVTWFAGDVPERFADPGEIGEATFAGGRDCAEALERAFEEAGEETGALVVWFHGSQPVAFPDHEALEQVLDRRFHPSRFAAVALQHGGNRLLEKLAPWITEAHLPRVRDPEALARCLEEILTPAPRTRDWRRAASAPDSPEAEEVGDQLARWSVWEDLRASLGKKEPPVAERQDRATRYQLVTPWSGAVVLERKADYAAHGLAQIDPATATQVPSVPEPTTALLVILSALAFVSRRRRAC